MVQLLRCSLPVLLLVTLHSHSFVQATQRSEDAAEDEETATTEENYTLPPLPTLPSLGVCQMYSGKLCQEYLKDAYVFVPPNKTVSDVETEISTVFNIFRQSK